MKTKFEIICNTLCQSGKFESGEGTCAAICMDQLGSPRKTGCAHTDKVHAVLASQIVKALRK